MKAHNLKYILIIFTLFSIDLYSQHCPPEYTSGTSLYYIEQYKIGEYNQGYDGTNFADWGDPDFYDRSNIKIDIMDSVAFAIELKLYYAADYAIFIDTSQNNEFEQEELIYQSSIEWGDTTRVNFNLLLEGYTGEMKIRIRTVDDALGYQISPCDAYENGVAIDHMLNILPYVAQKPSANFYTRDGRTSYGQNEPIIFEDSSQWKPTSWNWEFPGGTPSRSGSKRPIVIYKEPGCYDVTLTSSNAYGSNSITKSCYIEIDKYCYPGDTTAALTNAGGFINGFTLGQISNQNTNTSGDPSYNYFPNMSTNLSINTEYTMNITTDAWYIKAWIDFNQDGKFSNSEMIYGEDFNFSTVISHSFLVPESAKAGRTRLRIRAADYGSSYESLTACSEDEYVETEDYNVDINLILPVTDFEASATLLSHEDSVNFTDNSVNQIAQWSWEFEGGIPSTSQEQHPQNIKFPNPGVYTVALTASNAAGSITKTKSDYITVEYVRSAMFSANKTRIYTGESVNFVDESDNSPTSWTWYIDSVPFYQSNDVENKNPENVFFHNAGRYDITLSVEGEIGSKLSRTKKEYIIVENGTSIDEYIYNPVSIFPNPNNGSFALFIEKIAGNNPSLTIQDLQGRIVYQEAIGSTSFKRNFDLSYLDAGIYMITLKSSYQHFTKKLQIN